MSACKIPVFDVEVDNQIDRRIGETACHLLYIVRQIMVFSFLRDGIPGIVDDRDILLVVSRQRVQQVLRRKFGPRQDIQFKVRKLFPQYVL